MARNYIVAIIAKNNGKLQQVEEFKALITGAQKKNVGYLFKRTGKDVIKSH